MQELLLDNLLVGSVARKDLIQDKDNTVSNQSFPSQEDFNEKNSSRIAEISSLVEYAEQVCCPGDEPLPPSELVLYAAEEPSYYEPLNSYPLANIEEPMFLASDFLDWVLQKIRDFHQFAGVSCEGFDEEMMAFFTAIEADRKQKALISSPFSKSVSRGDHELKRLSCCINYNIFILFEATNIV